jgi:signal peptidase II
MAAATSELTPTDRPLRLNPSDPTPSAGPGLSPPAHGDAPSPTPHPQSLVARLRNYRVLFGIALVVLVLDQLTKGWIAARMPLGTYGESAGAIPVIRGFFYLAHVGNPGAAWSMFSGYSALLAVLAAGTLFAIVYWRRALGLHARMSQICFGLLCGGIVGNLVDRLRYGYVVDFIDLHFGSYSYPTFNVADSGICVGVLLYLWHSLKSGE